MPFETCILTTKDYTILEILRDRCLASDERLASTLKRKLDSANVVLRDDVPADVATLSSRVSYSVDGWSQDGRILSHDRMTSPIGMFLPITTPRGLALLGMCEGQEFLLVGREGVTERIVLEKVHYQPEAARRMEAARQPSSGAGGRPLLRLIRGAFDNEPGLREQARAVARDPHGFDDPGPSAA